MKRASLLLLALGLLGGCRAALRHASPADAAWASQRWPGTTTESLEADRRLYALRCSGCHGLHLPDQYPPQRWPKLLDEMSKEAKISPAERAQLERFVVTLATVPPPAP